MIALLIYWIIAAVFEIWIFQRQIDEGVEFAIYALQTMGAFAYVFAALLSGITFPYTLYQFIVACRNKE